MGWTLDPSGQIGQPEEVATEPLVRSVQVIPINDASAVAHDLHEQALAVRRERLLTKTNHVVEWPVDPPEHLFRA